MLLGAGQAFGNLGDVVPLEAAKVELLLRGQPRAVRRSDGPGTVRGAALQLADVGEVRRGVGESDHDHTVMQQRPMDGHDGSLVATTGRGRGEHAADLADQRALYP